MYKYGTYGEAGKTVSRSAVQADTVVVYIGTAPVNLLRGYADLGVINNPVKLFTMQDAQRKIGYSADDWDSFTLGEALSAHFNSALGNIGPITAINVLNPDVHRKNTPTDINLAFVNGHAEFKSDKIILDTLALDGLVEGTDYLVDYNYTKGAVIISSAGVPLTGAVMASYTEVDSSKVTVADIIGGISLNGEYSGLGALSLVYQNTYDVPNLVLAPGYSHIPEVYNAILSAVQKINGHWYAFALADIPLRDGSNSIDNIDKAKVWKLANGYTNEMSKVCWPMAVDNSGRRFHMSTLVAVTMLRTDMSHSSVPYETPGNKPVPIAKLFFGDGSSNKGYDQQTANQLTSEGITTAVAWAGQWVIWGDHTAAYAYGTDVDPRAIFDVSMRMLFHIINSFQQEWGISIDKPLTRAEADRILNREQEKLDALKAIGALIGDPIITFDERENPISEIVNGSFQWDILVTPTPPLKAATVYVSYTDAGFSVYFEGGE